MVEEINERLLWSWHDALWSIHIDVKIPVIIWNKVQIIDIESMDINTYK